MLLVVMDDLPDAPTLVVGLGIAGAMVGWQLRARGLPFVVVDRGEVQTASRTAAGVLNPVTGKRLVKTWHAEKALPFAKETYRAIEAELGQRFLYESPVLRVCKSAEERKQWDKRRRNPAYQPWLGDARAPGSHHAALLDAHGIFPILHAAHLDLDAFLPAVRTLFEREGAFWQGEFRFEELCCSGEGIRYNGEVFGRVIYCQGWTAEPNPYFGDLPFAPAKGEILELRSEGLDLPPEILNREKWILPTGKDTFKIGSTWGWERLDNVPTARGESALRQGLARMLDLAGVVEKVDHRAGVRPCTEDRRPFLGSSGQDARMVVFNGFGSKGTFYTPLLAHWLLDHLVHKVGLPAEVDIQRFDVK